MNYYPSVYCESQFSRHTISLRQGQADSRYRPYSLHRGLKLSHSRCYFCSALVQVIHRDRQYVLDISIHILIDHPLMNAMGPICYLKNIPRSSVIYRCCHERCESRTSLVYFDVENPHPYPFGLRIRHIILHQPDWPPMTSCEK